MSGNRKMTKWFLVVVLMLATVLPTSAFAATGDVTSIDFDTSESNIELTVNEGTVQLRVLATLEGSVAKKDVTNDVTWISSDARVVKVDGGLLTPLSKGTAKITAKYKSALKYINVTVKYAVDELKLDQADNVEYKLGTEGIVIKAIADGSNDVTTVADWTTSDSSVLKVDKGKVELVDKGTATVTATYKGVTASVKVKVVLPYGKLVIEPNGDQEMLVGDAAKELKAFAKLSSTDTAAGTEVTDKVKWNSSNESVAKIVDGKLQPISLGKTTITASYLGSTASVDVYVRNPYESLLLTNKDFVKNPVMFLNQSESVGVEVRNAPATTGGNGGTSSVTDAAEWTSSNPLAVTVNKGQITAKAVGSSTIKVSYMGLSKEFNVTVHPTVTKFEADPTSLSLLNGESKSAPKVTGTLLDEEEKDFSNAVQWFSSNETVFTVEGSKLKAVGTGSAQLTAKIGSKEVVTIPVTVSEKVLVLLADTEVYQIVTGKTSPLPQTVTAVLENGNEVNVTTSIEWSMTGSTAVIKDGTIKGLVKGNTTLTGTYLNQTIKIPVSVEQEVIKIAVAPTSLQMNIKQSKSIKVTGFYANGKTINLSSKVNWVSSNEKVATVNKTSVKAVGEGTATLSGSYQGKAVSVTITVVPKLAKLTVSERKVVLAPGSAKTVNLMALYDTGSSSSVNSSAVWTSSKPNVATVNNGQIVAVAKGTASIKAKFGGKTVTVTVSVKK